ncbi:MAG: trimethylamine methyltransferase family protein, partial [Deltaproteobacteria bacterium]|nr:trimethylamine methyltransferase family protein [Deltaproteobacteria bacterium]
MLPYYNVLTDHEIQMVHEASLEVLQTTGLRLNHPVAIERLADAGAEVDGPGGQVRLPMAMIEKALEKAPKTFVCAGRTPEYDVIVSSGSTTGPVFRSTAGAINHYDFFSNMLRPLTLQDCRDVAILMDALENMNIVGCPAPQDAPPETYDLHTLKVMLEAGRKHIWALPENSRNLRYQIEMMKAVAGGSEALRQRPLCSGIVCLIEPLYFPNDEIERLLLYGEYNLPVKVPLVPMVGANAPYTLAGALTQTHAEALGSLVLLQTLCPGIPTWYYVLLHEMDMHRGTAIYHSPEIMMVNAGLIQMARHWGIPSAAVGYATTDCQAHQIMFERGAALTMYALSGITEIGAAGAIEGGLAMSPLALVVDNELAAYTRRLTEGMEINRDTLAVEAINRVGHRGDFMSDPHTLKFLRREKRFKPDLFDWR